MSLSPRSQEREFQPSSPVRKERLHRSRERDRAGRSPGITRQPASPHQPHGQKSAPPSCDSAGLSVPVSCSALGSKGTGLARTPVGLVWNTLQEPRGSGWFQRWGSFCSLCCLSWEAGEGMCRGMPGGADWEGRSASSPQPLSQLLANSQSSVSVTPSVRLERDFTGKGRWSGPRVVKKTPMREGQEEGTLDHGEQFADARREQGGGRGGPGFRRSCLQADQRRRDLQCGQERLIWPL